jgi:hypothetical protein
LSESDVKEKLPSDWTDAELEDFLRTAVSVTEQDRKENQLLFYKPNSPKVQAFHDYAGKTAGIGGGNGSGKSDAMIADTVMCMTGIFPESQKHLIDQKFRGPINCRLVIESLTNTLENVILPKLQWWKWSGIDRPGGARGHWGWIPKNCLIDGSWERSWSSKTRTIRMKCRDPRNPEKELGESTYQIMSKDMDPSDFASGDFHIIDHDEPPILPQWRENEARTMRVNGRLKIAMTWPDDPSIPVDWLYNEVYEPGLQGFDQNVKWFEFWTTENPNLDQHAVSAQSEKWSTEIRNVRIYGRPIRFSNRIHPDFTDSTKTWCFPCGKSVVKVPGATIKPLCGICGSDWIVDYCHVEEFDHSPNWPTIFLIDPHPRKPHMWMHVQIDPQDDWWVVADGKLEGDCVEVREDVHRIEKDMGLVIARRIGDPNMMASPSGQKRGVTWQDEFSAAGLHCELGDDVDVGRQRINQMLKPDRDTARPRIKVHSRCRDTIYQLNRYVWAEFSKNVDRDVKQAPKDTNDDYPSLLKYLANSDPVFGFLRHGAPVITRGKRVGAYGS